MSNKTRLDVLLTERGLAESRQKAQAVIMAGHVFVAGQRVDTVLHFYKKENEKRMSCK